MTKEEIILKYKPLTYSYYIVLYSVYKIKIYIYIFLHKLKTHFI